MSLHPPCPRRPLRRKAALALVVLLAGAHSASAEKFAGVVTQVIDGDTLIVRYLEHHISVQLEGVDAPEAGDPYAERSGDSLARLCLQRTARVVSDGSDEYGRVVGEVVCNGVNVNEEQLRRGMGRLEEAPDAQPSWRKLQVEAKSAGRGLWAGAATTPH